MVAEMLPEPTMELLSVCDATTSATEIMSPVRRRNAALALENKVYLNKPQERYVRGQFLQAVVCNAMHK